jgi:hypothetical protein
LSTNSLSTFTGTIVITDKKSSDITGINTL